jgi:hypothetical protein
MLQRQIVVKALVKQIDIGDPGDKKYFIRSFQSIACMLMSIIVTIDRTVSLQKYQTSYCITTAESRSCS